MPPPRLPPTLFDVSCAEAAALCLAGLRNCDQLWTPPKPGKNFTLPIKRDRFEEDIDVLQSGAAYHSLGFEDENLGSSPGWCTATVATYLLPKQTGGTTQILVFKTLRMIGRPALYRVRLQD